jgi:helicase
MNPTPRQLETRRGIIFYPTYIPVTSFGEKYPLDKLIQPYLPRLAQAIMVSYHYAKQMREQPRIPMMVDSGGFASLFENAKVAGSGNLGTLTIDYGDRQEKLHPKDILDLQEQIAEVAFSLDFPIPPKMGLREAKKRQRLTIANAHWAITNRRRRDLKLFACIQAWDVASARDCARAYAGAPFDGIAIGGLVPRVRDKKLTLGIIEAVRNEVGNLPLHAFGLGNLEIIDQLFGAGVDSVDSSSYVKMAANGRLLSSPGAVKPDPSPTSRLHIALCNLAAATGRTLPLSAVRMVFETHEIRSSSTK